MIFWRTRFGTKVFRSTISVSVMDAIESATAKTTIAFIFDVTGIWTSPRSVRAYLFLHSSGRTCRIFRGIRLLSEPRWSPAIFQGRRPRASCLLLGLGYEQPFPRVIGFELNRILGRGSALVEQPVCVVASKGRRSVDTRSNTMRMLPSSLCVFYLATGASQFSAIVHWPAWRPRTRGLVVGSMTGTRRALPE